MLVKKLLIVSFFSSVIFPVFSDAIIFQTDFNELPDNWYATASWEFGPVGAVTSSSWPATWLDADMFTGDGPAELIYFVPDGTDSIIVTIPYYLNAGVCEGDANFEILMGGSGSGWNELWSRSLSDEGTINETATINVSPNWISGGEWIGIRFKGYGSCIDVGYLSVNWQIHSLTITAIGDSLALDHSTWARIKSASEWE